MQTTQPANPSNVIDTLIVGAGISGLSLGHTLQNDKAATASRPWKILVTESQGRVGGRIVSSSGDGFLWEEGPNSFSPTPALLKLAVDVGLKDELVFADRRLPRYVYWKGELIPVPMSPPALVKSHLLSLSGKLRALVGALGFVPPAMGGEETVGQYFRRHLGAEVTQRLVEPFVSGVYAGDPDQLSAAAAFGRVAKLTEVGGGLIAGAVLSRRPKSQPVVTDPDVPKTKPGELGSFRTGMQALPEAIAKKLGENLKLNWHLLRLRPTDRQTYLAEFSTPEGSQQVEARSVVLTTPAYVTAELLQPLQPSISHALEELSYPPVACVVLGYPADAFKDKLQGFGNLIPRGQGIRTLGTIWASSLFAGRAPEGWNLLINFIGGATDLEIGDLDQAQIVEAVHQDLCRSLLKTDVPPKVLAVNLWKRAIPQYTLGHHRRLEQIEQGLRQLPGLYLCGNYTDGVALGDCVRRGLDCASVVGQYLAVKN
ncbi:MAG: protoporphyrinogen oxidase [Microcoleus vaginatus WJT46-NPBG5]|jgi:oxygen-dependent protoporphyrinogen oxidase|nr:protoporphyrinogen oxidase [Microcoleus vaginatus WJT46-NPBG5]